MARLSVEGLLTCHLFNPNTSKRISENVYIVKNTKVLLLGIPANEGLNLM